MTTAVTRKYLAYFIRSITYFLWGIDYATGLRPIIYFLISIYAFFLLAIFSFNIAGVVEGIIASVNYKTPENNLFERNYPVIVSKEEAPFITASAAGVYDRKTGRVLYSRVPDQKAAPASTTKLMTALVSLELYSPEEKIKIPYFCTNIDSTKAWLPADEEFYAYDLIKTMLIGSAGDAACALATAKISYSEFVERMNVKADSLGMKSTNFINPIGLDGYNGVHFSTVSDLHILAMSSISNENISNIVKTREFTINSLSSDFSTKVFNTNRLLWELEGTTGIKTGTTAEAGEVLIYGWKDDLKEILIIVMGSSDRFGDTLSLLNWSSRVYAWEGDRDY